MPQDQPTLPEILFDGFLVYQHLSERAASRTSPENVSDVLDAVVKALRASSPKGAALPEGVREFIEEISKQKPEKPDYWSSCGQCSSNISKAEDLLDTLPPQESA